ncbi:MAG: cupin domain-containing protein [Candidatus Peribacteraceae bacterium]|nr:cupin domain-containing protein [Candidatus Peribacteraceae bacterium]MDD5742441.1 cupin domain-containing protein [Candidatus Peribacteraceae bacterium]
MKGYVANIEQISLDNTTFRTVLYTSKRTQLVVMSIPPGEDIGMEVHEDHDQFIRVEQGTGKAILDGVEHPLEDGSAVVIPAGTQHDIVNTGKNDMRLYTIYAPPEHRDGTVHPTKADAKEEHFDGKTSE